MKLLLNQLRILGNFADRKKSDLQFLLVESKWNKIANFKTRKIRKILGGSLKDNLFHNIKNLGKPPEQINLPLQQP